MEDTLFSKLRKIQSTLEGPCKFSKLTYTSYTHVHVTFQKQISIYTVTPIHSFFLNIEFSATPLVNSSTHVSYLLIVVQKTNFV